ncbi:MAG: aromatic acid exporter family protein [Bacillus sp. (in: firmicutes)]
MFTIGTRTIKTAISVVVALVIAQLFELDNASTAAVIALLSVQSTKKQSVIVAMKRFTACIAGMLLATVLFEGTAYMPITIGLLLFLYIPIMAKLQLQDGIVPGFVIIMQMYVKGDVSVDFLINQVSIVSIGIIVALIVNLYMPSTENKLREVARETEENMKQLLLQLSRFVRQKEPVWNDEFDIRTAESIKEGQLLAKRNVENSFFRKENYYEAYFNMRSEQIGIIQRVLPSILHFPSTFEQSEMVAQCIENIALSLHESNPAIELLEEVRQLKETFREMELPKTRQEFETRAALLILINEIERFLALKTTFYEKLNAHKITMQ